MWLRDVIQHLKLEKLWFILCASVVQFEKKERKRGVRSWTALNLSFKPPPTEYKVWTHSHRSYFWKTLMRRIWAACLKAETQMVNARGLNDLDVNIYSISRAPVRLLLTADVPDVCFTVQRSKTSGRILKCQTRCVLRMYQTSKQTGLGVWMHHASLRTLDKGAERNQTWTSLKIKKVIADNPSFIFTDAVTWMTENLHRHH